MATVTLTTGTDIFTPTSSDSSHKTTSGDDTFFGSKDGTGDTLNARDIIDGGAGTDTLIADITAAATAGNTVAPRLTSVEKLDLTAVVTDSSHVATFDASKSTGLQSIKLFSDAGETGTLNISNIDTTVAVELGGGTSSHKVTSTVTYNDVATAGKVDSATITASGDMTNLTAAGIEKFTLNANALTAADITIADATDVIINAGGKAASSIADLSATLIKNLTIAGTQDITVGGTTAVDFAAGAALVDITNTNATTLKIADGGAGTDSLTLTSGAGKENITITNTTHLNTMSINTGAGDDTVTLTSLKAGTALNLGDGNDTLVIGTISNLTGGTVDFGAGDRDVLQLAVTTLSTSDVDTAKLALINKMAGLDVVASNGDVTAIDAGLFTDPHIKYMLMGTGAVNTTMSNVDNDTLIMNAIQTGTTGNTLTVGAVIPSGVFNLELNGTTDAGLQGATGSTDTALTTGGIATVNIFSTTSEADPTTVTNSIKAGASTATHSINNVGAGKFVLTGDANFEVSSGVTAGFTNAVDFNATTFTGKLTLTASADIDIITVGSGGSVITGGAGNDVITLGAGKDTVIFSAAASDGNGKDTINNFHAGSDANADVLNVKALGNTVTSEVAFTTQMTSQVAITNKAATLIATTGEAGNLFKGGTHTISDFADKAQVATYLEEAFTVTNSGDDCVFILNDTAHNKVYVYDFADVTTTSKVDAADLALVGIATTDGALTLNNIDFS